MNRAFEEAQETLPVMSMFVSREDCELARQRHMFEAGRGTLDNVAMAILKAEETLSAFENALNEIGVDTSNSLLQFIDLPAIVGMLYGLPDNDDTYNVISVLAAHLTNDTFAANEDFIAKVKEYAADVQDAKQK